MKHFLAPELQPTKPGSGFLIVLKISVLRKQNVVNSSHSFTSWGWDDSQLPTHPIYFYFCITFTTCFNPAFSRKRLYIHWDQWHFNCFAIQHFECWQVFGEGELNKKEEKARNKPTNMDVSQFPFLM